jgi:hypothetical protein
MDACDGKPVPAFFDAGTRQSARQMWTKIIQEIGCNSDFLPDHVPVVR